MNNKTTLRQAALTAGFGLLAMAILAPIAQMYIMPKLIVHGDMTQTVHNIMAEKGLFLCAFFCYLVTFILDVVVAWALYVLLVPVNRSFSLLAAWFRVVYAGIAIFATVNLITVFKLVNTPDFLKLFGAEGLKAQVILTLDRFGYAWNVSFFLFSIYLLLLACLVYRSGYIPRIMGILLAVSGLGYLIDTLRPFLFPGLSPNIVMVTALGELVFMVWLLVKGWKLQEQD